MKITFICGSLEPGFDGVGDYVRRLAGELLQNLHEVTVVAINDWYVNSQVVHHQKVKNNKLQVLRLPKQWPTRQKIRITDEWIEKMSPDWVSVQFVPFAFHTKGLPFSFLLQVRSLLLRRKLHFMIHETWVPAGPTFKSMVYSILQKGLIKCMISLLKPNLIHTHIPIYKSNLNDLGVEIKSLPLFSNIKKIKAIDKEDENILRIGFFSQIDEAENTFSFISQLCRQAEEIGKELEILLLGGNKEKMLNFKNKLQNSLPEYRSNIRYTGFLKPKELSYALQSCSLGLSSVPRHMLGKSGSVAAFINHGVPVAAPNVQSGFDSGEVGFFSSTLCSAIVTEPNFSNLELAKQATMRAKREIQLSTIAKKMISDMKN